MRYPDELKFLENRKAPQRSTTASLKGKVCVVTGATSGVGLAAARRLARGGASLVLVCRDPGKVDEVRRDIGSAFDVPVDVVLADFARLDEVRAAAAEILRRHPRIDVLVNNAGMHSTKRLFTPEGVERVFCVNHLAPFLLTRLLLPGLLAFRGSRIVDVNSEGHRFCGVDPDDLAWNRRRYTGLRGYGASKSAQLLTVWEFADRLEGTGTTIVAMHPGDVRTNIGGNNGRLYRWFDRHVTSRFLMDAELSGEAVYFLAAAPEMEGVSGRFLHRTIEERPAAHALDRALGRRVWETSCRMTGLDGDLYPTGPAT